MEGKEGKKHVTTACTNCRRRKIKCNGETPCSHCQPSSQPCIYNAADDKRRYEPSRIVDLESVLMSAERTPGRATHALRARLSQLEKALQAHNIELPPQTLDDDVYHDRKRARRDSARSVSSSRSSGVSPHTTDGHTASLTSGPEPEQPGGNSPALPKENVSLPATPSFCSADQHILAQPTDELASPGEVPANSGSFGTGRNLDDAMQLNLDSSPSPRLTNYAALSQSEPAEPDNITNSLSARMGSLQIAEDGQLRYYGPTSNLHLYHAGLHSSSRSTIRHVATEGTQVLARAGLDHPVAPDVERHLADLYFAWEDPSIHVVDEEIFFLERQKWKSGHTNTPYYSETLNSAICAIGASLATGDRDFGQIPSPEFFSARAKALLDVEMDSPSVATVQALVIMRMAVRLSADLGLHLDVIEEYRNGMLSQRDFDVRRTTFWGVFIHDNMWSMYVGRPWGISIRDISVSRPVKELDDIRRKMWKPCPLNDTKIQLSYTGILDPLESCTDANITLCEFMRRINRTFMQFYTVVIFLLRPYFSRDLLRMAQAMPSHEDRLALASVRAECITAAHSMADVLRCYRKQYTLRHTNVQIVHLIFTASLVHVYNACTCSSSPHESQTPAVAVAVALDDLQSCCQALGEIGEYYGNATRALDVVILVKREWQKLAAVRTAANGHKRARLGADQAAGPGSSSTDLGLLEVEEGEGEGEGGCSRRAKKRGLTLAVFDASNPPRFTTPTNFETFSTTVDNNLSASLGQFPREGGDMYDAWHFLNWAEIDSDLLAGVDSTAQAMEGGGSGLLDGEDVGEFTIT
ncbi:hypothetical protein DHEL01_v207406 [Diaporthe helianthi]|uniref:Zn(2)-C6 fungal-type domain-containing protein n=1 Tax=Diaporthe helianthi TaxID=158607 RepID=A0A2P5HVB5_DIAHE|nr:hypothetical protein DHEL01_v207406 [Diaporthe helianthi]